MKTPEMKIFEEHIERLYEENLGAESYMYEGLGAFMLDKRVLEFAYRNPDLVIQEIRVKGKPAEEVAMRSLINLSNDVLSKGIFDEMGDKESSHRLRKFREDLVNEGTRKGYWSNPDNPTQDRTSAGCFSILILTLIPLFGLIALLCDT